MGASRIIRHGMSTLSEHDRDDGKQKSGRFSRPSLCASHHITTLQTNGDGVFLHRRGFCVSTQLQIFQQRFRACVCCELGAWIGTSCTDFHRNIIVFIEVDSLGLSLIYVK